jgi:hypothetical protein
MSINGPNTNGIGAYERQGIGCPQPKRVSARLGRAHFSRRQQRRRRMPRRHRAELDRAGRHAQWRGDRVAPGVYQEQVTPLFPR